MFFVDGKATDATSADDKPYTYDSNNDSPGWASPAIGQTPPGYAAVPQYQYSQGYTYATGDRVAQRAMPSRGSDVSLLVEYAKTPLIVHVRLAKQKAPSRSHGYFALPNPHLGLHRLT
jgi:hypothetical protein